MLSLGGILEALAYRALFSVVNAVASVFCGHRPVASTKLGHLIRNLFSGVGAPYLILMCAWAVIVTLFSLLQLHWYRDVSLYSISVVWALERLYTWTWQYAIVTTVVFAVGRRKEMLARQVQLTAALAQRDIESNNPVPRTTSSSSTSKSRRCGSPCSINQSAVVGDCDDLSWYELQWFAHHDFDSDEPVLPCKQVATQLLKGVDKRKPRQDWPRERRPSKLRFEVFLPDVDVAAVAATAAHAGQLDDTSDRRSSSSSSLQCDEIELAIRDGQ